MKILCAYSGVEFTTSLFTAHNHSLTSREAVHPIFLVPQKKLLQYTLDWGAGELEPTESYLYFLALLNSTDLIQWRTAAIRTKHTDSIVAQNMESLVRLIARINMIQTPAFRLHKVALTLDTRTLDTVRYWIQSWNNTYEDFRDGYLSASERERLKDRTSIRELALQRLIKDAERPVAHYARILADWAADAGEFPTSPTPITGGKLLPLSEYWKQLIVACCKDERIFSYPEKDLDELITHCEENIDGGSIYAHTLFELLRSGRAKQRNFLGFGDIDINPAAPFRIITDESSVEQINLKAMIDSAPLEEPTDVNKYPNRLAFVRAKFKWKLAQDYRKEQETAGVLLNHINTEIVGETK